MPTCQNCYNTWSWKETFKKSFVITDGMICPYCGEKQYPTSRMRNRSAIFPSIIFTLIMLGNLFFGPSSVTLFLLLGFVPLFSVINPFFVELSNEEETFF